MCRRCLRLLKISTVLVRLDHTASFIENARKRQRIGNQIKAATILARSDFGSFKNASDT
jgi:hypothetical protein